MEWSGAFTFKQPKSGANTAFIRKYHIQWKYRNKISLKENKNTLHNKKYRKKIYPKKNKNTVHNKGIPWLMKAEN